MRMKKTMSQNPNMLRTMIGIGLTLIFVLGYAVYSNTVESEYYGYNTSNEIESLTLNQDDSGTSEWYVSTNSPITWINVSVHWCTDRLCPKSPGRWRLMVSLPTSRERTKITHLIARVTAISVN